MNVNPDPVPLQGVNGAAATMQATEPVAFGYHWLASLFARELIFEALATYRTPEGRALLKDLAENPALVSLVDEINLWTSEASDADLKTIAMDLAGEFAWLFLGVAGHRSAPPYRSHYVSGQGRLMQEPAVEMRQLIQRLDVRASEAFSHPRDHIAVLLSVLAALADAHASAEWAAFLGTQLLDWITPFRDRCAAVTPFGFCPTAATALIALAHADRMETCG